MWRFIVEQLKSVGSVLMLIGGFLEFSLPLEYFLDGKYSAVPALNLIFSLLSLIGCIIVWRGNLISGGLLGIIVGFNIMNTGEFFICRHLAGELVTVGGITSIIIGLVKIAKKDYQNP